MHRRYIAAVTYIYMFRAHTISVLALGAVAPWLQRAPMMPRLTRAPADTNLAAGALGHAQSRPMRRARSRDRRGEHCPMFIQKGEDSEKGTLKLRSFLRCCACCPSRRPFLERDAPSLKGTRERPGPICPGPGPGLSPVPVDQHLEIFS